MRSTDLIIFDFDGVVADSEPISLGTLHDALATYGIQRTLQEVRAQFLGRSLAAVLDYVEGHTPNSTSRGFADTWQAKLFAAFREKLTAMPSLLSLLDALEKAGMRYCVASSASFERLGVALDAMDLVDRFPIVFSADQVKEGKPAPDLFLFAAAQMQANPANCVVIEDSPHGIRAAKAAGMRSIGFVGGAHLNDIRSEHSALLIAGGAEQIVDSLGVLVSDIDASMGLPVQAQFEDGR